MKKSIDWEDERREWALIRQEIGADRLAELRCYLAVQKIRQIICSNAGNDTIRQEVDRILREIGL